MGRQGRARGRPRAAAQGRRAAAALAPGGDRADAPAAFAEPCASGAGGLHRGRGRDLRRVAARPRGRRRARAPDHRPRARCPTGPTRRRACRRTARPWPTPTATTCGSCRRPAARRASSSRAAARSGSTTPASSWRSSATPRRAWRWSTSPTRGRDAWRSITATLDAHGDEGEAAVSPDGSEVAYTFTPRADLNRSSEIRVAALDGGAVRAGDAARRTCTTTARRGRRTGATIAYASERSGFYELHLAGAEERQLTSAGADHLELAWHPDGTRLVAVRGRRNRFDLVVVDAATGDARGRRRGRDLGQPVLDARARDRRHLRGPRHAAAAAPGDRDRYRASHPRAAGDAARALRRARGDHVLLLRRPGDTGLPAPPGERFPRAPGGGRRLSARRPDRRLHRRLGRPRPVLRRQGLRVAGDQLPRLDGLRARLRAPQPRRVGRRRHEGLPRRRRPPAHTRLGRRRAPGDLRRQLRLLHGARGGDRRPRAPLPLRRGQVRRLRHPHLLGAGRPRGRAGPRTDDGPPVDRARGVPRRARPTTAWPTSRPRCSSPTASSTSA